MTGAGRRPGAADIGRLDPHVKLGVSLDAMNLAQLLDAVQHVPLDTPGRRILKVGARLHAVPGIDIRRHAVGQHAAADVPVAVPGAGGRKKIPKFLLIPGEKIL